MSKKTTPLALSSPKALLQPVMVSEVYKQPKHTPVAPLLLLLRNSGALYLLLPQPLRPFPVALQVTNGMCLLLTMVSLLLLISQPVPTKLLLPTPLRLLTNRTV